MGKKLFEIKIIDLDISINEVTELKKDVDSICDIDGNRFLIRNTEI